MKMIEENFNKTVIVVQGKSLYVDEIKKLYKDKNVIFSTWKGDEKYYSDSDIVVYNEYPNDCGPCNFNLQKITTLNGIYKAKQLNYEYVLKIRSDMFIENINKFFKILDYNKFNFLCWHHHEVYKKCKGYLVDYLMFSNIKYMEILWDINNFHWCKVPEIFITEQYIQKLKNIEINFFLDKLTDDNNIFWKKNNIYLNSYSNEPSYNSKYTFSCSNEHLNENYLDFYK